MSIVRWVSEAHVISPTGEVDVWFLPQPNRMLGGNATSILSDGSWLLVTKADGDSVVAYPHHRVLKLAWTRDGARADGGATS